MNVDIGATLLEQADPERFALPLVDSPARRVRVFDVGQGDCIGIVTESDKLLCYVDYGGLADFPERDDRSGSTRARLPVTDGDRLIPIVLTHWDKDHWWSATKNDDAERVPWLVPRQRVSPTAARFAARLSHAQCWPEDQGSWHHCFPVSSSTALWVWKCAPFRKGEYNQDRNVSGLVVALVCHGPRRPEVMLLPGDCPFSAIPGCPSELAGVVAFHHGSGVDFPTEAAHQSVVPTTKVIFSYGRNSYGHPDRANYVHSRLVLSETPQCRAANKHCCEVDLGPPSPFARAFRLHVELESLRPPP